MNVLGTVGEDGAISLESVSAEEVMEAILNSGLNVEIETLTSDQMSSSSAQTCSILSPAEEVVGEIFRLPEQIRKTEKVSSRKKLTSHRYAQY